MTTMPLPAPGDSDPTPPPAGRQNRIILILAIVAGVLLLAVVAITFLLIGQSSANPNAGDSPTPTPTATATESPTPTPTAVETEAAPPPVDNSTRFTSFDADLTVECDPTGEQPKPEITFSWQAANAVEAWYTPSDEDAKDDNYLRFPNANAGTQNDLTDEHLFPCNHDQFLDVTITLVGPSGEHVSRTVTYEDVNWGS
jgi:hypothetical protein